jgi:putative SOS response-associated peptidase YedK
MCNLYSMTRNREAILRLFRVSHNRAAAYEPRDAVFPGYQAPVVRKAADGERELAVLNWGFVLLQKDKAPKRVTNIRDDKAQSKFWKPSFEQRRCLVPASSYCEPKGEKPATWHWFSINGDDARPVFAFPGVWTRYKGPLKKNGDTVEQEVFAFMTAEPNELTASPRAHAGAAHRSRRLRDVALGLPGRGVQAGPQLRRRPDAHRAVGVRTQRRFRRVSMVP